MTIRPGSRRRRHSTRSVERRGRGPRGPVVPDTVPAWRTRAQRFDQVVLEALSPIDRRWHTKLSQLDIAVDEAPPVRPADLLDPHAVVWPAEVLTDGAVPLSRLVPAGSDVGGGTTRARIVLFRRPLELRAEETTELAELVHEVLVTQIATYLGIDAETIDPAPDQGPD